MCLPEGGLTPEEELRRAQDDTLALKSIVEPLGSLEYLFLFWSLFAIFLLILHWRNLNFSCELYFKHSMKKTNKKDQRYLNL